MPKMNIRQIQRTGRLITYPTHFCRRYLGQKYKIYKT
jgi:hypothetical protein